jgi:hypothetical protein
MPQFALMQSGVPLVELQACPQPPQWEGLLFVFTSQPFAYWVSQLANPTLHPATVQVVPRQPAVPLETAHTAPHAPQLLTSSLIGVSQPSAALALQFPYPAAQVMPQAPLLQNADPWVESHTLLH